jgi:hypothetical protein
MDKIIMRQTLHSHVSSIMIFHVYVFGIGLALRSSEIIWMALWRNLYYFIRYEENTMVFGIWLWNSGEPPP